MSIICACDPLNDFFDGRDLDPLTVSGVDGCVKNCDGGGLGPGPGESPGEVTGFGVCVGVVEYPIQSVALSAGKLLLWCPRPIATENK